MSNFSTEGQKAFGCLFDIITSCPDIFSSMGGVNPLASLEQIEGFDMNAIINDGGIEGLCALITGTVHKTMWGASIAELSLSKFEDSLAVLWCQMITTVIILKFQLGKSSHVWWFYLESVTE